MNEIPTIVVKNTISGKQVVLAWMLLGLTVKSAYRLGRRAGYSEAFAASRAVAQQ